MLELNSNNACDKIVVTLTERVDINSPLFWFLFEHIETKQTVSIIYAGSNDQSTAPQRYNEFIVNTACVFDGRARGQWVYHVYQQDNSTGEECQPYNKYTKFISPRSSSNSGDSTKWSYSYYCGYIFEILGEVQAGRITTPIYSYDVPVCLPTGKLLETGKMILYASCECCGCCDCCGCCEYTPVYYDECTTFKTYDQ